MSGPAVIVIFATADFVESETLVAVTVAVAPAVVADALKLVEVEVLPVIVPPPVTLQVTPLFAESLATVAVSVTVWPDSSDGAALLSETLMTGAAATVMVAAEAATVTGTVAASVTATVKVKVPAAVGVPEMAPVEPLSVRPPGSAPLAIAKVLAPEPPDADADASLYAVPTVALAEAGPWMVSAGLTVIDAEAETEALALLVAVTVAEVDVVADAAKVADEVVDAERLPPPLLTVHDTPAPVESLVSVALKTCDCPESIVTVAGETDTVMGCWELPEEEPPPHPAGRRSPATITANPQHRKTLARVSFAAKPRRMSTFFSCELRETLTRSSLS
jgi:hypothetical protein